MYLFVYKTTHTNGRYYIGRHQTDNLKDGYLGSGKWVRSIKDKSTLTREIIIVAKDFDELCCLEEYYIGLYFDDPLCMNLKRASVGLTSEDSKEKVKNGTHNWQDPEKAKAQNLKRIADGSHNFLGPETNRKRLSDGTHHFLGSEHNNKRVRDGTHPFLGARNPSHNRVKNGTHNFQDREKARTRNIDRVNNGTHNFLGPNAPSQIKWTCPHCNKSGSGKGMFTRWHGDNCRVRY